MKSMRVVGANAKVKYGLRVMVDSPGEGLIVLRYVATTARMNLLMLQQSLKPTNRPEFAFVQTAHLDGTSRFSNYEILWQTWLYKTFHCPFEHPRSHSELLRALTDMRQR